MSFISNSAGRQLSKELDKRGNVSKIRTSKKGINSGGCRFSRGACMNCSRTRFISARSHGRERHPGQHEAIVPRELWERVQRRNCALKAARGRQSSTSAMTSPLTGKIFDANGEPLYAQGAAKAGRRYRYYVSRSLVNGSSNNDEKKLAPRCTGARASGGDCYAAHSQGIAPGCWRCWNGRGSNRLT